jgi:8-oxo-dGTP pyrophosphatase MutT (NUDIX family)
MEIKLSCGVYLINSYHKILIGHPTNHKPNVWAIPKGRLESGETDHFIVAKRELLEETNINIDDFKISKRIDFQPIRYRETNKYLKGFMIFIDESFDGYDIKCESMVYRNGVPVFPEFDDFKWVDIKDAIISLHYFQIENLKKCEEFISTL